MCKCYTTPFIRQRDTVMALLIHNLKVFVWILSMLAEILGVTWPHVMELHENYNLSWKVSNDSIIFQVKANTTGWVGVGFSPHGSMRGADIVIGWVQAGHAQLWDYHGVGNERPHLDDSQDYELLEGSETESQTTITFQRKLQTCDQHDYLIDESTVQLIYAWGEIDPASKTDLTYHGPQNRGGRASLLLIYGDPHPHEKSDFDNLPYFDATVNQVRLNATRTLYWCRIIQLPELKKKHHIVKVAPKIEEHNKAYVHHIVVYFCHGNLREDVHGKKCWEGRMPENSTDCDTLAYGWAVGQEEFYYPEDAGLSIGGPEDPRYFHIEMHYDNANLSPDVIDSSGLRFYYTEKVRRYDAGTFLIGHSLWWPPMTVPPKDPSFTLDAYCASSCTKYFPRDGIKVFALFPHTHLVGSGVEASLIRDGQELQYMIKDHNYDFNFQYLRHVQEPINIRPGDEMRASCTYNTRSRSNVTFGGPATSDEMCFIYMTYYPRMPVQTCVSTTQAYYPTHQMVMQSALSGNLSIDPDGDKHAYKYLNDLDWSEEERKEFQASSRNIHSFQQFCTMEKQGFGVFGGGEFTVEEKLRYTPIQEEESPECKTRENIEISSLGLIHSSSRSYFSAATSLHRSFALTLLLCTMAIISKV